MAVIDSGVFVDESPGASAEAKVGIGLGAVEAQVFEELAYYYAGQLPTYGAVEFTKTLSLPANALVDTLDVKVTAARATLAQANQVAQVRSGPAASSAVGNDGQTLVVDFGTPRTVSTVSVPSPYAIISVATWNGAQFMAPLYRASLASMATAPYHLIAIPPSSSATASATRVVLPEEPRTERLQIEVVGSGDAGPVIAGLTLVLPDAPSDLELRIDGAAPAWTHPGPVQPGTAEHLADDSSNNQGERLVHLAEALAALTGDPLAEDQRSFELKLTSRASGLLKIEEHERSLRRIRRARFDGRTDTTLVFDAEGELLLPLTAPGLPATAPVLDVRLGAEASFGDERTLPPVGPEPFPTVDLLLDPDRAALLRLPAGSGLAKLTGVRLPLAAGDEGAEVRLVLWGNGSAGPDAPLPKATSEPVTLAGADTPDWVSFGFAQPVPFDHTEPPWAAVLVTRGRATLGLALSCGPDDALESQAIRLGPQGGPWSPPPPGLRSGALAAVRGRARVTGTPSKDAPLAPFSVEVQGGGVAATGLDPGPNGLTTTVPGGGGAPVLRLVAYGAGRITLSNLDIITAD